MKVICPNSKDNFTKQQVWAQPLSQEKYVVIMLLLTHILHQLKTLQTPYDRGGALAPILRWKETSFGHKTKPCIYHFEKILIFGIFLLKFPYHQGLSTETCVHQ
jgi:hypothetical protein